MEIESCSRGGNLLCSLCKLCSGGGEECGIGIFARNCGEYDPRFDFIEVGIRIIEMFGRDTGKTRNVFSGDYPSTRSNARAIFHWNELLITRDTSGPS